MRKTLLTLFAALLTTISISVADISLQSDKLYLRPEKRTHIW